MRRSDRIDGFSLAYDRAGRGSPVLLLHGWPGTRADFRALVPMLTDATDVVVPDLRGFGESDKHEVEPGDGYSPAAQARSDRLVSRRIGHRRAKPGRTDACAGGAHRSADAGPLA